jgi:hypothetical protein
VLVGANIPVVVDEQAEVLGDRNASGVEHAVAPLTQTERYTEGLTPTLHDARPHNLAGTESEHVRVQWAGCGVRVSCALDADDVGLRVMLAAMFAAMIVAVERWQRDAGREDLLHAVDEAMCALAANRPELRAAIAVAVPGPPGRATGSRRRQ